MVTPVANSSLDVAYWFFNRAEQDNLYLETDKVHHLLFWAQSRYAQSPYYKMLMPCLFLCDDNGFFEPNLKRIFEQGRPFMPPVQFEASLSKFLEQIWNEFRTKSLSQCKKLMTQHPLYNEFYQQGSTTLIPWEALTRQINHTPTNSFTPFSKKILVSQNGPVVVSPWAPRKVNKEG
ncbi:MAG: hypothetical protein IJ545_02955 [Alphaproteobacteria bacterium]|nr:hypothetical protein [Alphaproteobacteria bacterium]